MFVGLCRKIGAVGLGVRLNLRGRVVAVVAVFGVTVSGAFIPALAAWSLVLVVLAALALYETAELKRTAGAAA